MLTADMIMATTLPAWEERHMNFHCEPGAQMTLPFSVCICKAQKPKRASPQPAMWQLLHTLEAPVGQAS
jgi:hypothetical protein